MGMSGMVVVLAGMVAMVIIMESKSVQVRLLGRLESDLVDGLHELLCSVPS